MSVYGSLLLTSLINLVDGLPFSANRHGSDCVLLPSNFGVSEWIAEEFSSVSGLMLLLEINCWHGDCKRE